MKFLIVEIMRRLEWQFVTVWDKVELNVYILVLFLILNNLPKTFLNIPHCLLRIAVTKMLIVRPINSAIFIHIFLATILFLNLLFPLFFLHLLINSILQFMLVLNRFNKFLFELTSKHFYALLKLLRELCYKFLNLFIIFVNVVQNIQKFRFISWLFQNNINNILIWNKWSRRPVSFSCKLISEIKHLLIKEVSHHIRLIAH